MARGLVFPVLLVSLLLADGSTARATFPGANGRIYYEVNQKGPNEEIYSSLPNGSNKIRLTNNPLRDAAPAASADGTKIVFDRTLANNNTEIYSMNANGSGQKRLTHSPNYDFGPVWSPDGTKIAYTSATGGKYDIWVMNADGSHPLQITTTRHSERPDWSPDGSQIAFERFNNATEWDIYTVNPNGSDMVQITTTPASEQDPSWSPDGQRIAFDSYSGHWQVFSIAANGTDLKQLTSGSGGTSPSWSPDGLQIAFAGKPAGNYDIETMNADGSSPQPIVTSSKREEQPDWALA